MNKILINIIDLKCNNIFSLSEACKKVGYKVNIIQDMNGFKKNNSDILMLPGVGSFNQAMKTLKKKHFDKFIFEHVKQKNKLLVGICLGMQLLFNSSNEFKFSKGLSLVNGKVTNLKKIKNESFPHIGWKQIQSTKKNLWNRFNNKSFYFIHSYFCDPQDKSIITSYVFYGKKKICSSIKTPNIIGTQFHPEKSGKEGLKFLNELKKFV